MPKLTVELNPGPLAEGVEDRLATWSAEGVTGRLRAKDATLWSQEDLPELSNRIGWVDLPGRAPGLFDELTRVAVEVASDGITDVVVLGMGGSSLAPEVYQSTFGNARGRPRLSVLDSTHPGAIARLAGTVDLDRTVFLVSSKSGGTIETMSFFRYFWHAASEQLEHPGSRFIAITDPSTPLEGLANDRGFRRVIHAPPDVGGRYSALSVFGLVPAAMIGMDVRAMIARVQELDDLSAPPAESAGCRLGAFLGEAARSGRDKVILLASESISAVPCWVEQLVAESTGKDGTGLVPVTGDGVDDAIGDDRVAVVMTVDGDRAPDMAPLGRAGIPTAGVRLGDRSDIGSLFFVWEVATALSGRILGVQPFDQPDVQLAKDMARRAMSGQSQSGSGTVVSDPEPADAGMIDAWLSNARPGDYIAIQAWVEPGPAARRSIEGLAASLRGRTGLPVTSEFGPRFLHSTGQLHKGGADNGLFLQIADRPRQAMPVPETDFSFDRLFAAQADGDAAALLARGRRLCRVLVPDSSARSIDDVSRMT